MVDTIKFSAFSDGGDLANSDTTVGLEGSTNAKFNIPWAFLASGTTGERPDPAAAMYYRLRFNTTLTSYEFYDPVAVTWTQIDNGGDVAALIADLASHVAGKGASMIGLEDQLAVSNKTVQDMAEVDFVCVTDPMTTLANGVALSSLALLKANDLSDLNSASTARTNLGLGTIATQDANSVSVTGGAIDGTTIGGVTPAAGHFTTLDTTGNTDLGNGTDTFKINSSTPDIDTILDEDDFSSDSATALATQQSIKAYVDAVARGLNIQAACVCASTAPLTVTYDNGTAGVGATLTNAGAMAAFSVDGISPTAGQRVLIKDQASTLQNGIYTVTTVGSGAVNWVLTRATDFDTPAEIQPGDFVAIISGTAQAGSSWLQTDTVTAVGTDPIEFIQFSASIPVNVDSGGTGLTALTAYNLILGNGTSAPTLLAPSATTGVPLISQGASADPAYGTAVIAGGGTGATTAAAAIGNLVSGTSLTSATVATDDKVLIQDTDDSDNLKTVTAQSIADLGSSVAAASQAEMETGTATDVFVSPGRAQYHESACKGWIEYDQTVPTVRAEYNVSSVTDNGTGDFTINWTTAFSSAYYGAGAIPIASQVFIGIEAKGTSSLRCQTYNKGAASLQDLYWNCVTAFGDQ